MNFKNKKIFITGASRGIGLAAAMQFSSFGGDVIGTRTGNRDEELAVPYRLMEHDFSSKEEIFKCADFIKDWKPDILINNAGINKIDSFLNISPVDFEQIQQVNLFAPFILSQSALQGMLDNGWGRIVNISSVWGKISKEMRAAYSASKFGLDGMTIALAAEYSKNRILANCVAPGFINTELTYKVLGEDGVSKIQSTIPIGRLGSVHDVANLIIWLSSDLNTYVTGQNISIDGGYSRA
jgi:NAD(P)-dependent dehydrogenase (short-subunit alcohol dehydrogenase family)